MSSNWHGVQLVTIAKNHPINKCPFICTGYFAPGRGTKYCDKYVCLLSVRSYNSKTTRPNFSKLLVHVRMAVAQFSSDGVAICYVLPVLRMTSFLYHGANVQSQARRYVVPLGVFALKEHLHRTN